MKLTTLIAFLFLIHVSQAQITKIMIALGWSDDDPDNELNDVDVLDVASLTLCPSNFKPSIFPMKVYGGAIMKNGENIVYCGGRTSSNPTTFIGDCYTYDYRIDQWLLEPSYSIDPRYYLVTEEISQGRYFIMGGRNAQTPVNITEYYQNGVITRGPDLLEATDDFSAMMINDTHLLISSGETATGYSSRNFIMDTRSEVIVEVAERTLPVHKGHSTGKFFNASANEMQFVNIGYSGLEVYSPRDDTWTPHTLVYEYPLQSVQFAARVQLDNNTFVLSTGYACIDGIGCDYRGDFYQFDPTFGLRQVVTGMWFPGRDTQSAIHIPEYQVPNC